MKVWDLLGNRIIDDVNIYAVIAAEENGQLVDREKFQLAIERGLAPFVLAFYECSSGEQHTKAEWQEIAGKEPRKLLESSNINAVLLNALVGHVLSIELAPDSDGELSGLNAKVLSNWAKQFNVIRKSGKLSGNPDKA